MTTGKATSAQVISLAGVRQVQAMLADAEPVRTVRRVDPDPGQPRAGVDPGKWAPGPLGLPPDCPVTPLGVSGDRLWLLDEIGQVRFLDPPYGKGHVLGLFCGRYEYLAWAWPRWGKDRIMNGFANEEATAALIRACMVKGPWDPQDGERWQGCWADMAGNLVVHTGGAVVVRGTAEAPGELEGNVYPARPKMPGPLPLNHEAPFNPAQILRPILRTWNWQRPEVDPHLFLGWIGGAFLGGALPWRPMAFITGDKATGKSSLQNMLKSIFGPWLVSSADTTAAGIYQRVGLSSRPVAIDELEAEADNRKVIAVLKLARLAASGDVMLRGGDRHQGVSFSARSAFIFSSINAPPLKPQDISRMALLQLGRLKSGQTPPPSDPLGFAQVGRCILHRLIKEWPRFHETFNAFANELAHAGMDGRGQAQFGTLLTCADMIEYEGWDEARLSYALEHEGDLVRWRDLLKTSGMVEFESMTENWRACLAHMISVRVPAWKNGTRHTVGQVLEEFYCSFTQRDGEMDILTANKELAAAGLRIVWCEKKRPWLVVHNQGPLVRELFDGTDWGGVMGAGVWSQALRQGPRGTIWEAGQYRVAGAQGKGTMISLDGLYGAGGIMADGVE